MQENAREGSGPSAPSSGGQAPRYDPERDGFDVQWARNAPVHELSAHGRAVQQRLDAPAACRGRPSARNRLRFAFYRWFHRR